jgi:hypothetical protein
VHARAQEGAGHASNGLRLNTRPSISFFVWKSPVRVATSRPATEVAFSLGWATRRLQRATKATIAAESSGLSRMVFAREAHHRVVTTRSGRTVPSTWRPLGGESIAASTHVVAGAPRLVAGRRLARLGVMSATFDGSDIPVTSSRRAPNGRQPHTRDYSR